MEAKELARGLAAAPLGVLGMVPTPGLLPSEVFPNPRACPQPSLAPAFLPWSLHPFLLHPDSSAYREWLLFPDK